MAHPYWLLFGCVVSAVVSYWWDHRDDPSSDIADYVDDIFEPGSVIPLPPKQELVPVGENFMLVDALARVTYCDPRKFGNAPIFVDNRFVRREPPLNMELDG